MRIAGGLISAGHLACGLAGWLVLGVPGAMLLFGLCAAVSIALALVASRLMERPPDGDGGIGTGGPDVPPEPPWWPDFELDFRDYVARSPSGVSAGSQTCNDCRFAGRVTIAAMQDATGLRERKKAKTRAAIVDAAYRLFDERGYQATTVADIAASADIAPRTFFGYFRSKEHVVYCDFEARHASLEAHLRARPAGETAIDALRGWIEGMLERGGIDSERDRVRRRLIADEPALAAHEDHQIALFEGLLRDAIAEDLGVDADALRARLVAAAATAALRSLKPEEHGTFDEQSALGLLDEALVFLRGGIEALQRQDSPRP